MKYAIFPHDRDNPGPDPDPYRRIDAVIDKGQGRVGLVIDILGRRPNEVEPRLCSLFIEIDKGRPVIRIYDRPDIAEDPKATIRVGNDGLIIEEN